MDLTLLHGADCRPFGHCRKHSGGALRRPLPVPLASMLVGEIHACCESYDRPDNQDSDHAFDDQLCRAAGAHNFHSFFSGFPLLFDFSISHCSIPSDLVCFAMRGAPIAASSYSKNPVHERANEAAFSPTVHERGSPRSFADGKLVSFVEHKIRGR